MLYKETDYKLPSIFQHQEHDTHNICVLVQTGTVSYIHCMFFQTIIITLVGTTLMTSDYFSLGENCFGPLISSVILLEPAPLVN